MTNEKDITCEKGVPFYPDNLDFDEVSQVRGNLRLYLSQFCLLHCRTSCQATNGALTSPDSTINNERMQKVRRAIESQVLANPEPPPAEN